MSESSSARPSLVLIVATIALALYAALLWFELGSTQAALEAAKARESRLLEQLQSLATMERKPAGTARSLDEHTRRGFRNAGIDEPLEAMRIALMQRPDLIEHEPVLGGTFFFLEDSVRLLSDRYVYAEFEDGHVMGRALLAYELSPDGGITLELIDSYLH